MWNGIEDIYINKTGEKIPDQFFFAMSGFCSFAYIKTNKYMNLASEIVLNIADLKYRAYQLVKDGIKEM
ncbi:MAG: hypothetical protein ACLU8F_00285 [Clostridia bacterium]